MTHLLIQTSARTTKTVPLRKLLGRKLNTTILYSILSYLAITLLNI